MRPSRAVTIRQRLVGLVAAAVLLPLVALVVLLASLVGVEGGPETWRLAVVGFGVVAGVAGLTWWASSGVTTFVNELERHRIEFRQALLRLGSVLESSDDRAALVDVVLDTGMVVAGAEVGVFYADAGSHLVALTNRGVVWLDGVRLGRDEGLAGAVATTGSPRAWPHHDVEPVDPEPRVDAALAVPIHARGRLYGVLALYGRAGAGHFGSAELDDLTALAVQAGAAIDKTYLHEEARRLSVTDGLTGVWNRRHFDLRCSQELDRAQRFNEEFGVVMLDIDDFKPINDTHGHQVGDGILVELTQRLVEATREVDVVARYGGEEFALVLPRSDLAGALRVAERVRGAIADEPFTTDVGDLRVTVSVGVALRPADGASVSALVGAADAAMYRAKALGKNRVCHAPDDIDPSRASP
ncbi:MAG TPA: sensor domain-containing diguanylate cyclase [Acidimicrobiales bacterium]|nr:sensor domain-containing diguanylate cyclase [Acidimicrobiales bacterium]